MRLAVLLLAAAGAASAETISTKCQTADVPVIGPAVDRRIVGCGEGFSENVLWHLDRSDSIDGSLDGKLTRTTTGRGAVIYVLDTGIRRDHEEFARATGSTVIDGYEIAGWGSATEECPDPVFSPCYLNTLNNPNSLYVYSHGTSVASVAGGKTTGVAPDALLVLIRVTGDEVNWIRALETIVEHAFAPTTPQSRTSIINISGGVKLKGTIPDFEALMRRMIGGVNANLEADPDGKRFLFVAAAGNAAEPLGFGSNKGDRGQCDPNGMLQVLPAALGTAIDGLIAVGGLGQDNKMWVNSCAGPLVEVLAPAERMLVASISARDAYRGIPEYFTSGTSYSTPYVSGMAARLLELDPTLTPSELELRLKSSPSRADGLPVPVWTVWTKRRSLR